MLHYSWEPDLGFILMRDQLSDYSSSPRKWGLRCRNVQPLN